MRLTLLVPMTSVPLASGVGVGASCWWSGEWQAVGASGSDPIVQSVQSFEVALALAAQDAASVIKESVLEGHGECRAKVLEKEEAEKLRSSYMIIAEAFRVAVQFPAACEGWTEEERQRRHLLCKLALVRLAESISPCIGRLEPTELLLSVLAVDKKGGRFAKFDLSEPLTVGRSGYGNRLVMESGKRVCTPEGRLGFAVTARFQAVIMFVPSIQQFVIVDPGSQMGMCIVDRWDESSAEPSDSRCYGVEDCSNPDLRRPLMCGRYETVVLDFRNGGWLVLNPRICLVCEAFPREVRLQCGHFGLCRACCRKLSQCPWCKAGLVEGFPEYGGPTWLRPEGLPLTACAGPAVR